MCRGFFADHQIDAVDFAQPFEARGEIDRVAEQRIIEMLLRAEIADDAFAGIDADADLHRPERRAGGGRFVRPAAVQLDELAAHRLGRAHRVVGMIGVVERRVPERHDAIADVFVDRAVCIGDDLGHRRQERCS